MVLLKEINQATHEEGGHLEILASEHYRKRHRKLLKEAEKECPAPEETQRKGIKGRVPRSKAKNLLECLRDFEGDVLRFMDEKDVPFPITGRK